ncbi:hypothetical protein [Shewanella glacialipiscicola]|uniref:hypothetical protein n=1 Tax=Shewanella glacialipiscicola TaxID=614069 RepID=UPI003D7B494D
MYFGIASEGVTDQVFIESLLCGFFENENLDEEIHPFQPAFDLSTQKQANFGGWTKLLTYLKSTTFRDDVFNCKYYILHIDTDVSPEIGFDVPHTDENNILLSPEMLIINIVDKLKYIINIESPGFFEAHENKFIFCIAIHSIECWLNSYYNPHDRKSHKTVGCEKALSFSLSNPKYKHGYRRKDFEKNYQFYLAISKPFFKDKKIIIKSADISPSLNHFISQLERIEPPNFS